MIDSGTVPDGAGGTGELTLASAASQILLLRREVKFLQKQWNTARVDQNQAMTREQMQKLRDEAAEASGREAAAREATTLHAAKVRTALRELKAARALVKAQQQRIARRSAAQLEVQSLKEQLSKAHEASVAQQQTLKQLQLRERLRKQRDDEYDEDDPTEDVVDARVVEAEAAHMGLGLLVLANELSTLERAWANEKGAAAELIAIKANMSFRVAQVEDDNAGLQAEVGRLRDKVAALQEEKVVMMGSLNALNSDLADRPEDEQHEASRHAYNAAAAAVPEQQPAGPPPERKTSAAEHAKATAEHAKANAKAAVDKKMAQLKSFKPPFSKKKKEQGEAPHAVPPPPPPPPPPPIQDDEMAHDEMVRRMSQ